MDWFVLSAPPSRSSSLRAPPCVRFPAVPENILQADVLGPGAALGGRAPWGSHQPLIKISKLLPQLLYGFSMLECFRWGAKY